MAGDVGVAPVPHRAWYEGQDGQEWPPTRQMPRDVQGGIAADPARRLGKDHKAVDRLWVNAVRGEELLPDRGLEAGKLAIAVRIPLDNELDGCCAEIAHAIEEHNGMFLALSCRTRCLFHTYTASRRVELKPDLKDESRLIENT